MRKWMKRTGIGVGSLIAVLLLSVGLIYAVSEIGRASCRERV